MKTTLNLNDDIIRYAKERAIKEKSTLTRIIENSLYQYLRPDTKASKGFKLRPLTKPGKPISGVQFNDRDVLYDQTEDRR